jgi:hypothetical protein
MNPLLIVFGIRAVVRLGRAGAEIYAQRARDKAVFLPDIVAPAFNRYDYVVTFYASPANLAALRQDERLRPLWDDGLHRPIDKRTATVDMLYAAAIAAQATARDDQATLELAGGAMIAQWSRAAAPISPVGRIAVTMADIALEFVGSNPAVMGIGGSGERLIGALALNLADLIPDDTDEFGPRAHFADRVVGIFLRSGLSVLAQHPDLVVDQEHTRRLVAETLKPLVAALPEDLGERLRWQGLLEALLGPAASAAFSVIAEKPDAFLGKAFATDKAVGAVTQALFATLKDGGLRGRFSDAGWIALYKAVLGVVAERPALFVGAGTRPADELIRDLLSGAAAALADKPGFDGDLGARLAIVALEALNANAAGVLSLDRADAWEGMALDMIGQVTGALSARLANPAAAGALGRFGQEQLVELARVFLTRAAATPGMPGVGRTELQAIVSGVAAAMAADDKLLLSHGDWLKIAAVAAEEAAANPGRLFGLDEGSAAGSLAVRVIGDLLQAASAAWSTPRDGRTGRDAGNLLAGATLRDAIVASLRAAAGNAVAAAADTRPFLSLARAVNEVARASPGEFGDKDWLRLFDGLTARALASGGIGPIDEATVREILTTRGAP